MSINYLGNIDSYNPHITLCHNPVQFLYNPCINLYNPLRIPLYTLHSPFQVSKNLQLAGLQAEGLPCF